MEQSKFISILLIFFLPIIGYTQIVPKDSLRSFQREIYNKFHRPLTLHEKDSFVVAYRRRIQNKIKSRLNEKIASIEETVNYINKELENWNSYGHFIPDSFFLLLMNKYYTIDAQSAIAFCLNNWDVWKYPESDSGESTGYPFLRKLPYLKFLFNKLKTSDLITVVLYYSNLNKEREEKLSRFFWRELNFNKSEEQRTSYKKFIKISVQVNKEDIKYNQSLLKLTH